VSDASHELRSPIATIREHAEVALAHPGLTRTDELAAVVLEADRRLAALVDDLLLLARTDELSAGTRVPVDLDDVVFRELAHARPNRDIDVDGRLVSAGRVMGDDRQLQRVVANLVDNAIRHAAGRVVISLRTVDGTVLLDVEDDGPGIALEDRERVFERFVRLDDARSRDDGGSGLGLAIVAAVVAAHGGSVRVDSSPLGGARFVAQLRALDDAPPPFSVTKGLPADDRDVAPPEIDHEGSPTWRSASERN
jgi:signal transduction histidine kinase